jgi:hypothetical protein
MCATGRSFALPPHDRGQTSLRRPIRPYDTAVASRGAPDAAGAESAGERAGEGLVDVMSRRSVTGSRRTWGDEPAPNTQATVSDPDDDDEEDEEPDDEPDDESEDEPDEESDDEPEPGTLYCWMTVDGAGEGED